MWWSWGPILPPTRTPRPPSDPGFASARRSVRSATQRRGQTIGESRSCPRNYFARFMREHPVYLRRHRGRAALGGTVGPCTLLVAVRRWRPARHVPQRTRASWGVCLASSLTHASGVEVQGGWACGIVTGSDGRCRVRGERGRVPVRAAQVGWVAQVEVRDQRPRAFLTSCDQRTGGGVQVRPPT